MSNPTPEFWNSLGAAAIIFALLAGMGACSLGAGVGHYYGKATAAAITRQR